MDLSQILLVLRARWRLIAKVFFAVLIPVVVLTMLWPATYTGLASIVVDAKTDPVAGAMGGGFGPQMMQSYVNTQADVIASPRVGMRVVKMLKLENDPELQKAFQKSTKGNGDFASWMASGLIERRLTVAPTHDSPQHASNVIEISVTYPDAQRAAALANAFAQAAIDTNIELKVEPAKEYAAWFNKRVKELRADLEVKQKRLSDYQNSSGLVATDDKLDVEQARLQELSTQLVTIQGLRQESQSRQRGADGDISSIPEVLQSPVVQQLKAELAQAEAKLPDVAARLGKNHPDYQAVASEIANLKRRIQVESQSIAASLGSQTQVNLRRENDIKAALEAQKKKVLDLRHAHDDASILINDVTSAQRDLDAVSQRYAQSSLESQTSQTNIVQLTVATPPLHPSSPKLFLNLLVGIFLGGLAGLGAALSAESMNPRVRQDDEMVRLLGVPILGKLGNISVKDIQAGKAPGNRPPANAGATW